MFPLSDIGVHPLEQQVEVHICKLDKGAFFHLEAAGLHIGAAVSVLNLDPPPIDDLEPPRIFQFLSVWRPAVPGYGELLCGGEAVLIRLPKDLADTPFKFLEACGKAGQEKLDLLRGQVEPGDDVALPGAVGIILDRNADQGMDLVVIF